MPRGSPSAANARLLASIDTASDGAHGSIDLLREAVERYGSVRLDGSRLVLDLHGGTVADEALELLTERVTTALSEVRATYGDVRVGYVGSGVGAEAGLLVANDPASAFAAIAAVGGRLEVVIRRLRSISAATLLVVEPRGRVAGGALRRLPPGSEVRRMPLGDEDRRAVEAFATDWVDRFLIGEVQLPAVGRRERARLPRRSRRRLARAAPRPVVALGSFGMTPSAAAPACSIAVGADPLEIVCSDTDVVLKASDGYLFVNGHKTAPLADYTSIKFAGSLGTEHLTIDESFETFGLKFQIDMAGGVDDTVSYLDG